MLILQMLEMISIFIQITYQLLCTYISIHIKKIASGNTHLFLPKPKWFCLNKEMFQKHQYEIDNHLGSIPLNEFMCDHMHENYNYQIHLLHDHLIHSCIFAAERAIPFTKSHTKQHSNKAGWNEHVSKEFDRAQHWHRLYLQHGRPQSGYIFEMRNFTRSIYDRKVKQINSNPKRIKRTRIANAFLENRSRDFWSEISKMWRKPHRTPCIVEGFSNNEDIYFLKVIMKNCITLSLSIPLNGQIYTKLLTIRFVMNVLITLSMLMMSKIPSKN